MSVSQNGLRPADFLVEDTSDTNKRCVSLDITILDLDLICINRGLEFTKFTLFVIFFVCVGWPFAAEELLPSPDIFLAGRLLAWIKPRFFFG